MFCVECRLSDAGVDSVSSGFTDLELLEWFTDLRLSMFFYPTGSQYFGINISTALLERRLVKVCLGGAKISLPLYLQKV
jgi:hypothetical protein